MSQSFPLDLPKELQPFLKEIESSLLNYISIKITPDSTTLWQSKFGGLPYLPKNQIYPVNEKGKYLRLIAQLNFTEIPALDKFPSTGILQFFIDGTDEIYGLDFNNPISQSGFRVLYYPTIDKNPNNLVNDFSFLPSLDTEYYFPIRGEFSLKFNYSQAPISPFDEYFSDYLPELTKPENSLLKDYYTDYYEKKFNKQEHQLHQLGGYPYFTQSDPRIGIFKEQELYQLLLQIDSEYFDNGQEICWGDVGIANFFIQPSALEKLNFSQVLYNWDCT